MNKDLPNKLTYFRIILTFVIILILLFPFHSLGFNFPVYNIKGLSTGFDLKYLIAGIIFVVASITDFVDGYLARKYNWVSDRGKMLDAIADKILVNSVLIVLSYQGFIPVIIPIVIITRDTIVDVIKMEAGNKGKVVAAIKSGKYKTAVMMIGLTLTFVYNLPFELWNIDVAGILLYIAMILSVVSGIQYWYLNKNLIIENK